MAINITIRVRGIDPSVLDDILGIIEAESKGVVIVDRYETRE